MEPERPIEKLLRAFAKKRRDQAGDPMKLHPAMRRQLQQEVARRSAKPAGGGWLSFFGAGWLPRFAFALCFVALVLFGLMLLPPLQDRKPSTLASLDAPRDQLAQVEKTAPTLTPPPVSTAAPLTDSEGTRSLQDKQKDVSKSIATAPAQTEVIGGNRQLAIPPATTPPLSTSFDDRVAATAPPTSLTVAAATPRETPAFKNEASTAAYSFENATTLSKAANNQPAAPPSLPTAGAPAGQATFAANQTQLKPEQQPVATAGAVLFDNRKKEIVASTPPASQLFNRLDMSETRRRNMDAFAASAPATVLASFRVEQNGNTMRVVDADGSVYTGAVQVAQQENATRNLAPKNADNAARFGASQIQAARNYFFRVAGTNHNLNQNVVFSGNFIPFTNLPNTTVTGTIGGGARSEFDLPVESLLSNSRISGTAVIGNQKEIQVDATPAPTPASTGVQPRN